MPSAIMNGSGEAATSAATTAAMGTMISTVAVLLISWPSSMVSTHTASSANRGEADPTRSSSRFAMASAVPVDTKAVDSGIIPPTSTTVVHETAGRPGPR